MNMTKKDKHYDKKIFRIIYVLNKLDGGGRVSTRELAEEFNVSIRTVQRDLELVNSAGFPIVPLEGPKGTYTFLDGFSLKRMLLSEEEASLLSFLYEIAHSLGTELEESFRELFKRVLTRNNESPFYIKMPDGQKLNKDVPFIKEIEEAVCDAKKIELQYLKDGKDKGYKVAPLKIIFYDGFWYLLATVDERDWVVKFRLDKITKLNILEEEYDIPENVKLMLDESVNIWFSEKRDKRVILKVDSDSAEYFKQQTYFIRIIYLPRSS